VEIVRAAVEDFIAGKTEFDADGALTRMAGEEHWHPDIELDVSEAVVPEMRGVFRGKEAVRRWWGEWLGAWETVEFEYELLDAGDRVVVLIDQRMRGRSTGIEVSRGKYAQGALAVGGSRRGGSRRKREPPVGKPQPPTFQSGRPSHRPVRDPAGGWLPSSNEQPRMDPLDTHERTLQSLPKRARVGLRLGCDDTQGG
jgi:SnoaL-like domain